MHIYMILQSYYIAIYTMYILNYNKINKIVNIRLNKYPILSKCLLKMYFKKMCLCILNIFK